MLSLTLCWPPLSRPDLTLLFLLPRILRPPPSPPPRPDPIDPPRPEIISTLLPGRRNASALPCPAPLLSLCVWACGSAPQHRISLSSSHITRATHPSIFLLFSPEHPHTHTSTTLTTRLRWQSLFSSLKDLILLQYYNISSKISRIPRIHTTLTEFYRTVVHSHTSPLSEIILSEPAQ